MADSKDTKKENREALESAAPAPKATEQAPRAVSTSRREIAGTIAEGAEGTEAAGEVIVGGEKVSEVSGAGKEQKGGAMQPAGVQAGDQSITATFTFDEKNLPPAPEMIRRIEKHLRAEISHLEKKAREYKGGLFRNPDYNKYGDAVIQIRQKRVLLGRLLTMAADALKKLFIQIFKPKNV